MGGAGPPSVRQPMSAAVFIFLYLVFCGFVRKNGCYVFGCAGPERGETKTKLSSQMAALVEARGESFPRVWVISCGAVFRG